jgi:hypothetical protein
MTQVGLSRAEVRELFWREWNPIGGGVPRDEYDTYADKAHAMVHEGRSASEIADYLFAISRDRMGLGNDQRFRELADKTATKLITGQSVKL